MRKVLTLVCLLAVVSHIVAQQCNSLPTYSETFTPQCAQGDLYVNWPNYENPETYYKCNGVGNPQMQYCPANQYFAFVLQQCVNCGQYIPAVPCSQLKTQNPPNCVPINNGSTTGGTTVGTTGVTPTTTGGPTLPTPIYPTSTTTQRTTSERTTSERTTRTTAQTEPTAPTAAPTGGPTPPTQTTSSDGIPGPPSPVTNDPNVPIPPTPGLTPPSIVVTPPSIVAPVAP